jgi:hypothetical protein
MYPWMRSEAEKNMGQGMELSAERRLTAYAADYDV